MKNKMFSFITLLTLFGVLAVPSVHAQVEPKEKAVGKKTLAKYDADKDGKLSPEEKGALEADRAKARADRKAKKASLKEVGAEPAK